MAASSRRALLARLRDFRLHRLPLYAAVLIALAASSGIGSIGCRPSEFLRKAEVTYNFEDEGFLDRRTLQTVAEAKLRSLEYGLDAARRRCLDRALQNARERALRAMLHVVLDIPSGSAEATSAPDFERDFPASFSGRDLIRAELDLRPLLERGYIALQDKRSSKTCSVVFRIEAVGDDLPDEIRQLELSFAPEKRPWLEPGKTRNQRRLLENETDAPPFGPPGAEGAAPGEADAAPAPGF